jgi:hypothetical protein
MTRIARPRAMSRARLILAIAIIVGSLGGCSATNPGPIPGTHDPVCLQDTQCYRDAITSFSISPNRAVALLNSTFHKSLRSQPPTAVIGRWYLFSFPVHHALLLNGCYVNGDSGEVEYRQPPYEIQWSLLGSPQYVKNSGYPDYAVWEKFARRSTGGRPDALDLTGVIASNTPYYLEYPVRNQRDPSYPYYMDDRKHKPDGVLPAGARVAPVAQKKNYIRVWTETGDLQGWVIVDDVRQIGQ